MVALEASPEGQSRTPARRQDGEANAGSSRNRRAGQQDGIDDGDRNGPDQEADGHP